MSKWICKGLFFGRLVFGLWPSRDICIDFALVRMEHIWEGDGGVLLAFKIDK